MMLRRNIGVALLKSRIARPILDVPLFRSIPVRSLQSNPVPKNDEDAYLDLVQKTIEERGGKIAGCYLGRIPKPKSIPSRPVKLLNQYPERFQMRREGNGIVVSLTESNQKVETSSSIKQAESVSYVLVETLNALKAAIQRLENDEEGNLTPDGKKVIAVDLEGSKVLETLQVASSKSVVVVDCRAIERGIVGQYLGGVLSSNRYIKLMHDVRQDAIQLADCGVTLNGVLDTQLVAEAAFGYSFIGLNPFLERINLPPNPEKKSMGHQMNIENRDPFDSRPLQHKDLLYAAYDVSCLIQARDFIWSKFPASSVEKLLQASKLRVSDALDHGLRRLICFDETKRFRLSSSEIFRVVTGEKAYFGKPATITTSLNDVIDLLPKDFGAVLRDDSFPSNKVSDIALDIGRRPYCMLPEGRKDISSRQVTPDDVFSMISRLGSEFGSDGRATMPDSLNRMSAIRGRTGEVHGITIRIGRTIHNQSDLLLDFLLGTDKSILILGKPASGKTSVLRDMARVLSSTRNVVVIDKSNEIGGDGPIPHESIGSSRRMMVPNGEKQQLVMIECVENHAPQVMVIDEIGHMEQVKAAQTVKDRGVRMIATAHGDLCGLIDNPVLNGLVGGVITIPVTDDAADREEQRRVHNQNAAERGFCCQRRRSPAKLKTQRVTQPVFDVIIEVDASDRNAFKVIPDTARAVDDILLGMPYHAHMRSKDPDSGTMFYEFAEDFLDRICTMDAHELGISLDVDEVEESVAKQ